MEQAKLANVATNLPVGTLAHLARKSTAMTPSAIAVMTALINAQWIFNMLEKRWFALLLPLWMLSSCCLLPEMAQAQIKVPPEVSAGQPLVAEVVFPEPPEGAKPADLLWQVGDSGFMVLTDSSIAVWPVFGTNDKQLTIIVSGGLVAADGKYVPKSNQRFEATLVVRGVLPTPGPSPGPQPPPPPVPDGEAPIKEPGLRVLITYESQLGYPAWLSDRDFTEFLTANCVAGPKGVKEWRMLDKDAVVAANAGVWVGAIEKMRKQDVPAILISTGKIGTIEKLPATKAEAIALIKKYAEAK